MPLFRSYPAKREIRFVYPMGVYVHVSIRMVGLRVRDLYDTLGILSGVSVTVCVRMSTIEYMISRRVSHMLYDNTK